MEGAVENRLIVSSQYYTSNMVFKQALLICFVVVAMTYALSIQQEENRNKRDTGSDAMAKMEDALKGFKEGFNNFMSNISQSDFYKQVEKFGADLGDKGKELGAKIEETLSNLKKSTGS